MALANKKRKLKLSHGL